jgi:hypothetical protein
VSDSSTTIDDREDRPAGAGGPTSPDLEASIRHLAAIDRPSASPGEREAAISIAQWFREHGCDVRLETERAHGTYWWPLGLLSALAGAASLTGRRRVALAAGALAAAAIADDISGGAQWFRRRFLPLRPTYNVVALTGDPDAERTVVLVAHHDAAHWSLLFHPAVPAFVGDRWPGLIERTNVTAPVMFPVFGGPLLVALGGLTGWRPLRRAGTFLSWGTAATMAEIGSRSAVPGANDNLSGVATLLGVARSLHEAPVERLRVLLVSTGSEESFMEGMQAFARRHFPGLPVDRTHVICVDTVGSPELIQLEGEGMLRMNDYDPAFKDLVSECAREVGVPLRRGLRFRNSTDALIAHRHGYPTVMLGSVNRYKLPDNYHWPTDDADRVDYGTVRDAVRLCDAVVRRLARA